MLPEDDSPPLLSSSSLLLALALPAAAGWCHHPPRWPNFSLCILIAASNRCCCSSVRETPSSESACSCSELLQPSPCRMTAESHVCTAAITALWAAQRSSTAWAAQTAAIVPLVASILRRCGAPAMDLCYTNQTKHTSQRLAWRAARPQADDTRRQHRSSRGSCAATSGISSRRTSSALIGRSANSPNPRPAFLARRNALPAPSELGSGSLLLLRCQLCGGAAIMSIEMALSTSLHKRTASEHRSNSHDTELERNHRPNGRAAVHHRRDPASGARANSHCLALRGLGQPLGSHSAPARPLSWAARPVRRPRGQPAQGPGPSTVVRAPQATEALRSQQTSV